MSANQMALKSPVSRMKKVQTLTAPIADLGVLVSPNLRMKTILMKTKSLTGAQLRNLKARGKKKSQLSKAIGRNSRGTGLGA